MLSETEGELTLGFEDGLVEGVETTLLDGFPVEREPELFPRSQPVEKQARRARDKTSRHLFFLSFIKNTPVVLLQNYIKLKLYKKDVVFA